MLYTDFKITFFNSYFKNYSKRYNKYILNESNFITSILAFNYFLSIATQAYIYKCDISY